MTAKRAVSLGTPRPLTSDTCTWLFRQRSSYRDGRRGGEGAEGEGLRGNLLRNNALTSQWPRDVSVMDKRGPASDTWPALIRPDGGCPSNFHLHTLTRVGCLSDDPIRRLLRHRWRLRDATLSQSISCRSYPERYTKTRRCEKSDRERERERCNDTLVVDKSVQCHDTHCGYTSVSDWSS